MGRKKGSPSTRHSKITGDLGEYLVLYLLSKAGFESVRVDHTGIDLIAIKGDKRIGISVKSTSTFEGKYIDIDDDKKLKKACAVFNCRPYYAIVTDVKQKLIVCILDRKELVKLPIHRTKKRDYIDFKMNKKNLEKHRNNRRISMIEFEYNKHPNLSLK